MNILYGEFQTQKTVYLYPNTGDIYYELDVDGKISKLTEDEFSKIHKEKIAPQEVKQEVNSIL